MNINNHSIYDAAGNVLVSYMEDRREELLAVAKDVATKRQEIVYVYGNGREAIQPAPTVGCPATISFYSDRHAATVIAVSPSGHKVTVREDKAVRTDGNGMSDSQTYSYEADPAGSIHTFYRQKNGTYGKSPRLTLGVRNAYHDYTF